MLIVKHLTWAEFCENQTVFEYGDRGDTFYVVLGGSVDIYTPSTVGVSQVVPFFVENVDEILWREIEGGTKIKKLITE